MSETPKSKKTVRKKKSKVQQSFESQSLVDYLIATKSLVKADNTTTTKKKSKAKSNVKPDTKPAVKRESRLESATKTKPKRASSARSKSRTASVSKVKSKTSRSQSQSAKKLRKKKKVNWKSEMELVLPASPQSAKLKTLKQLIKDKEISMSILEKIPVEWKAPHSLADLGQNVNRRPIKKSLKVLGLERPEWQDIFQFLPYKTLKTCREVCKLWNNFISQWEIFAKKTCLVFDGITRMAGFGPAFKLDSFITNPKLVPLYQSVRLQNAEPSSSRFWLGRTLPFLTTLELKNASFNWLEFLEMVSLYKNLTSLSIVVDESADGGPLRYFSLFVHDLHMYPEDISKFDFSLQDSHNYDMVDMDAYRKALKNLKFFSLDVMFVDFANTLIKFIVLAECRGIEEFRINLHRDCFLEVPFEHETEKRRNSALMAGEFLQNNGGSLKRINISFRNSPKSNDASKLCEFSELIQNGTVNLFILRDFFENGIKFANLEEFGLDLGTFTVSGDKMKTVLQKNIKNLQSFMKSQINLKKFGLSEWCWTNEFWGNQQTLLQTLIPSENIGDIEIFVLGGYREPHFPKWNDFGEHLTSIKIQWEKCNMRRLNEMIPEKTREMEKVVNFELLNNLPICFVNFDVPIIASKFPNLTRLHLEDIDQPVDKNVLCAKRHRIMPAQFFDADLHLIFEKLTLLETLFIKTRMYPVTDFAFTGILPADFGQMDDIRKHDFEACPVTGYRISNLQHLKSVTLIGLSYNVTDISALAGFNVDFPHLTSLDFITSGMTKKGKDFLKQKFGSRSGFKLKVAYPKPKRGKSFRALTASTK